MVKTFSPLLSSEASGTLAKQLTFLNTRRGCTIRKRVRPRDPRSGEQLARRACFHFLTKNWSGLSTASQNSWSTCDPELDLSYYNTYVRHNLKNWHNFLAPGMVYPVDRTGNLGTIITGPNAVTIGHVIELEIQLYPMHSNWGLVLFASQTSSFSTSTANTIAIRWLRDVLPHTWTWEPPSAGTWYFNLRLFSVYGNLGGEIGEFTPP